MSEQPGRYQRSFSGMVGAIVVLVLVIGAFVGFRALNRAELETPVDAVDYEETMEFAREQVDLPIVAPGELPEGWRATSVRFVPQPAQWHLGVLTDADRYVGLEQANRSEAKMVQEYVDRDAVEGDPVEVDGESWRTWTDAGGDTALTRVQGQVTTLVVGTPGQDVLVDFVALLR